MHIVQRSDGSPDYGILECDNCGLVANRDVVAAFNLIGMGEMQRVYGEGVWRREGKA
jgi:transposase